MVDGARSTQLINLIFLQDILIAGDFNADEGYVNEDDWSKITLRTDRRFKWLIDDQTDTTVGNTDRAYDR